MTLVLSSIKEIQQRRCVLLADETVFALHGSTLLQQLGSDVTVITIAQGEHYKTRETVSFIENQMLSNKHGRDSSLIAFGGGVVTDIGGFVASTYCRGISYTAVPTTLLGMVDAAIGGKNGINTSYGKNLIGTIYQPETLVLDPQFLKTLPEKEFAHGIAEVIKHSLVADSELFLKLEEQSLEINEMLLRNYKIKSQIVSKDPFEQGCRRLLNFGHTVAHAIEKLSQYTVPHGQAVAYGLIYESILSFKYTGLPEEELFRIVSLIKKHCVLNGSLPFSKEALFQAMIMDKKSQNGTPRCVFISRIGNPVQAEGSYCMNLTLEMLFDQFPSEATL